MKSGSILPLEQPNSTHQKNDEPIEIRIYPGGDASFTIYEDEGDDYNYEKGKYSTIELKWNDLTNTLTIGERMGSYNGMEKNKRFRVVLMSSSSGMEVDESDIAVITSYSGNEKKIQLN